MKRLTEDGKCSLQGCDRPHHAGTYCLTHYRRFKSGRDLTEPIREKSSGMGCKFEGCPGQARSKGYCNAHYEQLRRGRPLSPVSKRGDFPDDESRILQRIEKNAESGCWEWTAGRSSDYGVLTVRGRSTLAHRFSYTVFNGEIPEGLEIDHQCRNRICVNPEHLKAVTRKENLENLGVGPRNKSGYRGVGFDRRRNTWTAYTTHNGKQYRKSGFDSAEEANSWVVSKRLELHTNNVEDRGGLTPAGVPR